MTTMRVALVVSTAEGRYDGTALSSWIRAGDVDLVVFPEGFAFTSAPAASLAAIREVAIEAVKELADELSVPVLAGVWCADVVPGRGMQTAAYWNPAPQRGDTRHHFYAKHSTSEVLPYAMHDYIGLRDAMLEPVRLKGRKIGIELCHDQFFGLISSRLVRNGADVLVDLTGDSVVPSKWFNVVAGRSLEHMVPFLCTMAQSSSKKTTNVAMAFGFRNGAELVATRRKETKTIGHLALLELDAKALPVNGAQTYSPKTYSALTLALAPSKAAATIRVSLDGAAGGHGGFGAWRVLRLAECNVGVLSLPAEALRDPLCIHAHEQRPSPFDAHLVCFTSERDVLSQEETVILSRLRAIEHRVAIVVCTPSVREVVKSSRYKNVQRMSEHSGVFGIDLAFLGGTYATMDAGNGQGIPVEYQDAYLSLVDK